MSRSIATTLASVSFAAASMFAATAAQADFVCHMQEYLPLRDCPKPGCHEQYQLEPYSALKVYETIGKWYHVKVEEHNWDGFVLSQYVCPGDYNASTYHEPEPQYDNNSNDSSSTY